METMIKPVPTAEENYAVSKFGNSDLAKSMMGAFMNSINPDTFNFKTNASNSEVFMSADCAEVLNGTTSRISMGHKQLVHGKDYYYFRVDSHDGDPEKIETTDFYHTTGNPKGDRTVLRVNGLSNRPDYVCWVVGLALEVLPKNGQSK